MTDVQTAGGATPASTTTGNRVTISVDRHGMSGAYQLSINLRYPDGLGHGHRLCGPKFDGRSTPILETTLDQRDADEIRAYLDAVYPAEAEAGPPDDERATARRVLDLEMGTNDADAATVRDYLGKLLADVWEYGEGFDGKRPFGNSSWEYELYDALAGAGLIGDTYDGAQQIKARALVHSAIRELAGWPGEVAG